MDREKFLGLAARALSFTPVPEAGGTDHVVYVADSLRRMVDAEVRHLTLVHEGLVETLARLYTECVCALRGRRVNNQALGQSAESVAKFLYEDIFEPNNAKYADSFRDFGAVGVVVRLLDQQRVLQSTGSARALAHIANYALMALALLEAANGDDNDIFKA